MDNFQFKPNLTFNFGMRYEYFAPYTEKYNRIANLAIAPGYNAVSVVTPGEANPYGTGTLPNSLINGKPTMFSPRVGLAYKPWPKKTWLIRTGYGLFFNGTVYGTFVSKLSAQPPFANTANLVNSAATPLTLQNGFPAVSSNTIANTYAVDPNYSPAYSQTWNFEIQGNVSKTVVLDVTYTGVKGTHLDTDIIPNQAPPGSPSDRNPASADSICRCFHLRYILGQLELPGPVRPAEPAVFARHFLVCDVHLLEID